MNSSPYPSFAKSFVPALALGLLAAAGCNTPPPGAERPPAAPIATGETPEGPPTAEQPPGARTPVAEGGMCGGIAGFACQEGLYCAYAPEARCGAADASGTCRVRPEMCTEEYAPVCGCDDKTYGNACAAAREGISVTRSGECETQAGATPQAGAGAPDASIGAGLAEGQLCGTRGVQGECGEGLYCAYKRNCGADDSGGTCAKKTPMCTKIYQPVCGCDGKTYGNPCTAAAAGVSVAKPGECAP